jgi:hypothetical protein
MLFLSPFFRVQVELFEREEEDGEQTDEGASSSSSSSSSRITSLSVTVDTSEASYPLLEKPWALSEESHPNGPAPGHKSVMHFLNASLFLTLGAALLLVLGSLLVALSCHNILLARRIRLKLGGGGGESSLLQDTDDSSSEDNNKVFSSTTGKLSLHTDIQSFQIIPSLVHKSVRGA